MIFSKELFEMMASRDFTIKVAAGEYYVPLRVMIENGVFKFFFKWNKDLLNVVKSQFENRKWDNDNKLWSAPITFRNIFRLEAIRQGGNPYKLWEETFTDERLERVRAIYDKYEIKPFHHQLEMTCLQYFNRWTVIAAEMGLGKTLTTIMMLRMIQEDGHVLSENNVFWLSPKACIPSTKIEFSKWKVDFLPTFSTYESLPRIVREWEDGRPAPLVLVGDESTKVRNLVTKRAQATKYVSDSMREEHDTECWISELSGSPAPKEPTDYCGQVEIACPGFLAEANPYVLRERMANLEQYDGPTGKYTKVLGWKQDEIENLGNRLHGLVAGWFKKDCLDLPDKQYFERVCKPSTEILNIAKTIVSTGVRAIDIMTDLRMLSDGFQYKKQETNELIVCPGCKGTGVQDIPMFDEKGDYSHMDEDVCFKCDGKLKIRKIIRKTIPIGSPKDDLLREDLGRHEEVGRLNVYGGFQGTIDRITEIAQKQGWCTYRIDGRGVELRTEKNELIETDHETCLRIYMEDFRKFPKIMFAGQPGAAGMGLTLVVSPSTIYYSNSFNPLDRTQSEDRGHRIGMKENGGLIVDYLHLPTDKRVLDTLKERKRVEKIGLESIKAAYENDNFVR